MNIFCLSFSLSVLCFLLFLLCRELSFYGIQRLLVWFMALFFGVTSSLRFLEDSSASDLQPTGQWSIQLNFFCRSSLVLYRALSKRCNLVLWNLDPQCNLPFSNFMKNRMSLKKVLLLFSSTHTHTHCMAKLRKHLLIIPILWFFPRTRFND